MPGDVQVAVEEMLSLEEEAEGILRRSQEEARRIRSEGTDQAKAAVQEITAKARRRAEAILDEARVRAEAERDLQLSETDKRLADLERAAQGRFDEAVRFVVGSLVGEGQEGAGDAKRHPRGKAA